VGAKLCSMSVVRSKKTLSFSTRYVNYAHKVIVNNLKMTDSNGGLVVYQDKEITRLRHTKNSSGNY